MQAYRLTGLSKVDGVCDFIETLVDNGAKFLVFAHHICMIDVLEEFAAKRKIGYIRIDGRVAPERRHEYVKSF
jgi:SWI/SNF-related matrix-associated actin-dependent regulator of chromatin subfamily A-like protein 1